MCIYSSDSMVNKIGLIKLYAILGHSKTGSPMPKSEELERQFKPRHLSSLGSGSSQRPKYVFVVHLLGHNFQYDVLIPDTHII